jgi:hypothetical protein
MARVFQFFDLPFLVFFCFFLLLSFSSAAELTCDGTGDSSAGRLRFSTDLSSAFARSSAIFSASLLLIVLLSDCLMG